MPRLLGVLLAMALLASPAEAGQRVVGGKRDNWHAYPYYVNLDDGLCSGSLIAPDRVLTAAHCLDHLVVGSRVRIDDGAVNRRVVHLAQHPMLTQITGGDVDFPISPYDSAVLALNKPVTTVAPLRLATADDAGIYPPGTVVTTMGTGSSHYSGDGDGPFRTAQVQVRSDEDCTAMIRKERRASLFKPGQMLCTTDPDGAEPWASACYGDSGSPLVAVAPDSTPVEIGLDSWGARCGEDDGGPEQYTDVATVSAFALDPNVAWRPEYAGGMRLFGKGRVGRTLRCSRPRYNEPQPPVVHRGIAYSYEDGLYGYAYLRTTKVRLGPGFRGKRVICYAFAKGPGGPVIDFSYRAVTVR